MFLIWMFLIWLLRAVLEGQACCPAVLLDSRTAEQQDSRKAASKVKTIKNNTHQSILFGFVFKHLSIALLYDLKKVDLLLFP